MVLIDIETSHVSCICCKMAVEVPCCAPPLVGGYIDPFLLLVPLNLQAARMDQCMVMVLIDIETSHVSCICCKMAVEVPCCAPPLVGGYIDPFLLLVPLNFAI
ncbi:hypothetical protein TNCV_957951 [Trichonephila clavipes]|nr:hypothetical protein TNCV_957951 [Trichonephila clavipes]